VQGEAPRVSILGLLTFRGVRRFIGASHAWGLAAFLGLVYLLGSLVEGDMFGFAHLSGGYTITIITASGTGDGWWNYPAVIVAAPWGYLTVPFFTGVSMIVVAVGVALGMAVAVLLAIRLLRPQGKGSASVKASGAVAGLTPAMIGLVTLGACCSTTAAASAGVGLVAQASGTSVSTLLINDWYLGVFQVVVVWSALLAQELLLAVYGGLFGLDPDPPRAGSVRPRATGWRYAAGAGLRGLLGMGGLLWILATFAEWTTAGPANATAGLWTQYLLQHFLLGSLAVTAAFFPSSVLFLFEHTRSGYRRLFPALTLVAGLSLLVWLPPALIAGGLDSLTGQVLGFLGVPASWGAIAPGAVGGWGLLLRWGVEYAAVGGFAVAVSLFPQRVLDPLVATSGRFGQDIRPAAKIPRPEAAHAGPGSVSAGDSSSNVSFRLAEP
jgi:hypothetical protein